MNKARTLLTPLLTLVRLHWIALCVVAGLLVLYTLAGFFLVPYIARTQLTKYVTETLHRQISIGEIRFNPYTLEARIHDFRLAESDGSPLVSFRYLLVNATVASIWQRAVSLQEVHLDAPDIQLVIAKDGKVNLAQLAPPATEPPPAEPSAPMRVRIGTFAVTEGRVALEDRTHSKPFTASVAPIRFSLTDFKTDAGYANAYQFAGTTQAGEQLNWSGQFTVQPLGSTGQFGIAGLKAATIDSYLYDSVPFKLANGALTLNGDYRFALEPFALDVTLPTIVIRDLQLAQRTNNASAPIVVPTIDVQGTQFSYANHAVTLQQVNVKDAHIDVAREKDGTLSLSRLFGATPANPSTPSTSKSNAPAVTQSGTAQTAPDATPEAASATAPPAWKVALDTLKIETATVLAEDRSVQPAAKFALTPIALTVKGLSNDPAARFDIDADVSIGAKGRLKTTGNVQLEPLNTQLHLGLAGFELATIQPYLEKVTAMKLHSGQLGVEGDVSYAATPANAPPLKFTGNVRVADLRTTDEFLHEDFIKWRDLAISGIGFQLNPDRLSIDRIEARQPYARVTIAKDKTLNVVHVLNPGAVIAPPEAEEATADGKETAANKDKAAIKPAPTQPAPPAAKPFPTSIKLIRIVDGSANFADYSIQPSFATGILGLSGTISGLSSDPASRAKVKLAGKVDKYAPVDITGEVNVLAAAKYTDLAMNFRNMELTTFNPYSGKFAGYNISKGKLSTELKYKVADRKLDAAHHIVLDNLEFGAKTDSKDAAPIPLKLAIALLKDRNGVIDVNLPVSGTLDDPKFRLGPIIWKAVLGLLTKIVTAPFAALGALFGGGDEMAFIDFPAGSAVLPADQVEKLNKLAKALIERPQLKLSVPLTVVTAQDSEALAQAALAARVPADASGPATDDAGKRKRLAVLEKAYKEVVTTAAEYPPETLADKKTGKAADLDAQLQFLEHGLREKLQPDTAALTALAQQRSRAVQDALLANTELNAERVFITADRTEGKSEGGNVRMEMKLE
ncbi:MAG TPA: DUF748 domain-containing protein [Steroidobacteraceae bacterium]|jgi:hypothetical protein